MISKLYERILALVFKKTQIFMESRSRSVTFISPFQPNVISMQEEGGTFAKSCLRKKCVSDTATIVVSSVRFFPLYSAQDK